MPVINPRGGQFQGLDFNHFYNDMAFSGPFQPQALEQPTPVPEPATMTMMAAGLAALAIRRRRQKPRNTWQPGARVARAKDASHSLPLLRCRAVGRHGQQAPLEIELADPA